MYSLSKGAEPASILFLVKYAKVGITMKEWGCAWEGFPPGNARFPSVYIVSWLANQFLLGKPIFVWLWFWTCSKQFVFSSVWKNAYAKTQKPQIQKHKPPPKKTVPANGTMRAQGPRSNFWIEGAECWAFYRGRETAGYNNNWCINSMVWYS